MKSWDLQLQNKIHHKILTYLLQIKIKRLMLRNY